MSVHVHREGVNPRSMDGVPDLRDHNSFCQNRRVYNSSIFPGCVIPTNPAEFRTTHRYQTLYTIVVINESYV